MQSTPSWSITLSVHDFQQNMECLLWMRKMIDRQKAPQKPSGCLNDAFVLHRLGCHRAGLKYFIAIIQWLESFFHVPCYKNCLQHLNESNDNSANRFSRKPTLTDRDRIIPPFDSTLTLIDSACHFVPTNTKFLSRSTVKLKRTYLNWIHKENRGKRMRCLFYPVLQVYSTVAP